jgi:hypothetical protein
MKNADELLKRILLNMKYDPKMSLNENKIKIDNVLIVEQGQQIPTTMNQIMQFQTYIWKKVDKLPDPTTITDKTKKYNSKLCSTPCTVYNNKINGKIYSGAIDGIWGGNTKSLWGTYKETYKKYNPNWNKNDVKTQETVLGQTIPTSNVQIKNFQKWFLDQKEKSKPNSKNLYTTKLCSKPCVKGEAIDGIWGGNTKSLWNTYGDEYKKTNQNWSVSVSWTKEEQNSQILLKQRSDLAKIFRFTTQNPSGWNMVESIPKAIDSNISTKYAKLNPKDCPFFYGWELNQKLFPTPRKYTESELKLLFTSTGGDQKYKEKLKEKFIADKGFEESKIGKTNVGAIQTGETWRISDNLGYDRYVPDPTGQGGTQLVRDTKSHNDYWDKQLNDSSNKIYDGAIEWNKLFDKVKSEINSKCSTPLKICQSTKDKNVGQTNCVYISYSDVCRRAGGLWVYEPNTNNSWCGCRSMLDSSLSNVSTNSGDMIEFDGPNGKFTSTIAFGDILEYQTPETGGKIKKEREESHQTMSNIELALTAVAFVSGPFAPLFFGIAAVVGFVDGVNYYNEGDPYMGTMMMALSVLGAADIGVAFKLAKAELSAIKLLSTYGDDGLRTLIKTFKSAPEILGATEINAIKTLKQATFTSQRILGKEMSKKMLGNFVRNLPNVAKEQKWGWKQFAKIFWEFSEHQPTLKGSLIYLGGVPYTIDQIYLALYGNDLDRQKSGIATLFDYISKRPQEVQEALDKAFIEFQNNLVVNEGEIENYENFMEKTMGPSGILDLSKLKSDEEVLERFRKEGKIVTGFDQQRYDELIKTRDELESKIGCDRLKSLIELGWVEISKIETTKEKSKGTPVEYLETVDCGGTKYLINKSNDYIEKLHPKTNTGQPPVNKSILDTTNT